MRERVRPDIAVAVVYVSAMFINILDTTVVNVALPTLSREFDVGTGRVEWVITGYLLSLAAWIPASGWIGDRFGSKRVFLFALTIFTISSALCGAAQSLEQLIAFRILQGVGGGMLTPVGFAMLMRAFPPERRAQVSRIVIIPTIVAPASGPVIGGFLIDEFSWRLVFYMNLPVGIAALIFGYIFLREHKEPRQGGFDLAGFVLSGSGLALILYALSSGPMKGWGSPHAWGAGLAGVIAFAALIVIELRLAHPILKVRLVGDRLFRTAMLASTFSTGAFLGILFVMPIFLQEVRGASAFESGLTTFPEALGVLFSAQIAGRIYPRIGPRRLMAGGLTGMGCVLISLTQVDAATNVWFIRVLMFLVGASAGYVFLPVQASSFARISPADTGNASAIFNAQRQVSSALGVAVLATVLSLRLPGSDTSLSGQALVNAEVGAYHTVFFIAGCIALAGALTALTIRDSDAASTMKPKGRGAAPVVAAE